MSRIEPRGSGHLPAVFVPVQAGQPSSACAHAARETTRSWFWCWAQDTEWPPSPILWLLSCLLLFAVCRKGKDRVNVKLRDQARGGHPRSVQGAAVLALRCWPWQWLGDLTCLVMRYARSLLFDISG